MLKRIYGKIFRSQDNKWHILANEKAHNMLITMFEGTERFKDKLIISATVSNTSDIYWFIQKYPLKISDEDMKYMESIVHGFEKEEKLKKNILSEEYLPVDIKGMVKPLRKYQSQAVDLLRLKKSLLVGDETGLGKTWVGIGAIVSTMSSKPSMVICEPNVTHQWKEKFEEASPDLKVHIIEKSKPYVIPEANVYIFAYSKLGGWHEYFESKKPQFETVVFDEVQNMRHNNTNKFRASKLIADNSNYKLGLSATPIYNYANETFNLYDILKPGCLGTYTEFCIQWCGSSKDGMVENPAELGSFLFEQGLFLARTREDVKRELPEVVTNIVEVDYNDEYLSKMQDLVNEIKDLSFTVLYGDDFKERGQAARLLSQKSRYLSGIGKAYAIAQHVRDALKKHEKVLLGVWHRDIYKILQSELFEYKPVFYSGSENQKRKMQSKEEFVDKDSRVMIMSLRSGVGLDGIQTASNCVIFGELDWSPAVHHQFIGRLNRDGLKGPVEVTYLTCKVGSDPAMIETLALKKSHLAGIVDPGGSKNVFKGTIEGNKFSLLAKMILDQFDD